MSKLHLSDDVRHARDLYAPALGAMLHRPIAEHLERHADCLRAGHEAGHPGARVILRNWHPDLLGADESVLRATPPDPAAARLAVAREHGFADWSAVAARGADLLDENFEAAVDALLAGDLVALRARLAAAPDLANARSNYGHQATLLHYAAANGVETRRQVVPANLPDGITLLLEAGADVGATARIYGGATPLGLLTSSAHPRAAGVADAAEAVLRRAGAG